MISWLRDDFKEEGFAVSEIYEEDPFLPIDLFCTKGKGKKQECCVVIVTSTNKVTEEFQKKLFYYQYYLSLHYKPSQYRIILAIPASANVKTSPFYATKKEEKKQDFYKENGFGLWKIKDRDNIDKTTYSAITLRDKITRDFNNIIVKKDEELTKKTAAILPFVDRYIHDSVLGIARLPTEFIGRQRHIDQTLFEKALKLEKIPYGNLLFNLINTHLSNKNKSDFDFCTDTFNKLWLRYFKDQIYPKEHMRLEPLLLELYPKYRDHYIHQFQVFLLGAIILDILMENKKLKAKKGDFLCKSWLLAASFHDFAYPVQKYDDYACRFLGECLGSVDSLGFLELKNDYTEYSFSSHVEYILSALTNCFYDECFREESKVKNLNKLRDYFYYEITRNKNHALAGSLGLMKKFEDNRDFTNIILPAAVAIALHDEDIWQTIHGLGDETEQKRINLVKKLAPLRKLNFEAQPIAFLLMLCDNVQDWGRHFKDEELEIPLKEANIRLKDILFESNCLTIQLFFNDTRESRKLMALKEKTLENIEKLLYTTDIEFAIEYWDTEKNEPTSFKFKIGKK